MENRCCLCGVPNAKVYSNEDRTEQVVACDDCIVGAVGEIYRKLYEKKPWYRTKLNWGFWILVLGFMAFLVVWFVVKPIVGG